eukprot:scaffold14188_cov21-Prasinocladus_malaysianus.AAC.1
MDRLQTDWQAGIDMGVMRMAIRQYVPRLSPEDMLQASVVWPPTVGKHGKKRSFSPQLNPLGVIFPRSFSLVSSHNQQISLHE